MEKDKELLLKDLSARLLYGVKVVRYIERDNKIEQLIPEMDLSLRLFELSISNQWFIIKPYLRPMSSMTEEEINEFHKLSFIHVDYGLEPLQCVLSVNEIDWLNAHHFDYRGLISMNLALEAPKGMYKIN